jgi:hypothetical protein
MSLDGLLSVTFLCRESIRFYAGVRRSQGVSGGSPPEIKRYTYAIRVRLFLYTVFTQVFTVFSDFHCESHAFFSVYFRFRKPHNHRYSTTYVRTYA